MATFGERMAQVRQRKRITLAALKAQTGIDMGYLSRVERNLAQGLTLEQAKKIAKALEVSLDYLCGLYEECMRCQLPWCIVPAMAMGAVMCGPEEESHDKEYTISD